MDSHILYHYCSLETFSKIIQTKEIWLCNARAMNDLSEGKYVCDVVNKFGQGGIESVNFQKNHGRIYGKAYIACFSGKEDLFSQWERYADACKGFAIGFRKERVKKLLDELPSDEPDTLEPCINLEEVDYLSDEENKREFYEKLIKDFPSMFKQVCEDRLTMERFKNDDFGSMLWSYKNPFFRQENEYRIIYLPDKGGTPNSDILGTKAYRLTREGMQDYYPLKFNSDSGIIAEVMIGPLNKNEKSLVKDYLETNGYSGFKVLNSDGCGVIR